MDCWSWPYNGYSQERQDNTKKGSPVIGENSLWLLSWLVLYVGHCLMTTLQCTERNMESFSLFFLGLAQSCQFNISSLIYSFPPPACNIYDQAHSQRQAHQLRDITTVQTCGWSHLRPQDPAEHRLLESDEWSHTNYWCKWPSHRHID